MSTNIEQVQAKYAHSPKGNVAPVNALRPSGGRVSAGKPPDPAATSSRSESDRAAEVELGGVIGHVGLSRSFGESRNRRFLTMTNAERVEAAYAAFMDGDMATVFSLLDDDIEWVAPRGYPHGGVYRGHEGVGEVLRKAVEVSGPGWTPVTDRFVGFGDEVLVEGRHVGTGADGRSYEIPYAQIFTIRDGRVVRFVEYGDSAMYREISHA